MSQVPVIRVCHGFVPPRAVASVVVLALSAGLVYGAAAAPASAVAPAAVSMTAADGPADITTSGPQTVTSGAEVSIDSYTSADPSTAQWQESTDGGASWSEVGETGNTSYTFTAHYDGIEHLYRVGYTDDTGVGRSEPAAVTVEAAPPVVIDEDVLDQYVDSGSEVVFSASAEGDPAPTQQWELSVDGGDSWEPIVGETGESYSTTVTTADDGHLVRAVFTNAGGTVESTWASIAVNALPPTVTTQPANQTVEAGTDATFVAAADGDPAPTVQWQMRYHNQGYWEDVTDATSHTFVIHAPTLEESRNAYRAVFDNDAGSAASRAASLTVTGTAPSAPLGLTAVQTAPGEVTVTWQTPTNAGNSAISAYDVGYSGGQWGNGSRVDATEHQQVISDLATGTYTFSVAAVNLAGPGARVAKLLAVIGEQPTLGVSSTSLVAGQRLTVSGIATPGSRLTIERALPGQSYRAITALTVPSTGRYAATYTVISTGTYRARLATGQVSPPRTVPVQARVGISAGRVTTRTYTLGGAVYPGTAGQVVRVYQRTSSGPYRFLGSDTTDSAGRWSYRHRFSAKGVATLRAIAASTKVNAAGDAVLRLTVR